MLATIFKPSRTAMQSGRHNTRKWLLEFDQEAARRVEPLMGWTASADTRQQLVLCFATEAEAVAFCKRHDFPGRVVPPRARRPKPKSYAENFSYYKVRGPGSEPLPRP
jgi:hypothetical protein